MNKIKLLVYALIVCMSFVNVAEAKSRGGSYKSGFSSQKRNTAKPAPTYKAPAANEQTKKTGFGSFGSTNPKAKQNEGAPQSQMSKDLSATTAQSNALKTADARTKTHDNATASDNGWFRSGNQNAAPAKPQNTLNQPVPNTVSQGVERRAGGQQSGGFMQGLMWFMIGHSVAQHANATNTVQQNQMQNPVNNQGSEQGVNQANNSINTEGVVMQQAQDVPAEETESFFMKLVRVLLWVGMISGIIWVVRKVMRFRAQKINRSTNYSLGS